MGIDYTFYYIESNIVCIIIILMLLHRNFSSSDKQTRQVYFDYILLGHVLYFISDSFWVLIYAGKLPINRFSASLVNAANAIILTLVSCYLALYIEISRGSAFLGDYRNRLLARLPAQIACALIVILFVFFPQTMLDENYQTTGLYSIIFLCVPIVYIFTTCIRSLKAALNEDNYENRSLYLLSAFYPLGIIIFGIIQTMFLEAPIYCFTSTIMLIYMYLLDLDDKISLDPLTGLNNRAQLRRYMANELRHNPDSEYYVIMLDLNKFKNINDTFGHIEGDKAITMTADALKRACLDHVSRPFLSRYGGDEFIIILRSADEDAVLKLEEKIHQELEEENRKLDNGYKLSAAIGHSLFKGTYNDFRNAVENADKALYIDKLNR